MTFRTTCVALLLSSLPIAGCGTAANLVRQRPGSGGVSPFGGVKEDMACFENAANGELGYRNRPRSDAEQYPRVALMLFCAADMPLSFLGDVVTLPYTVGYSFINRPMPNPPVTFTNPPVSQPIIPPPEPPQMPLPTPPVLDLPPVPFLPAPQPVGDGQAKPSP
jgi:hypothetical protein